MPNKRRVLLTNDDGHFSEGLQALDRELSRDADVFVVAPDREKSACSHSLTLNQPLRLHRIDERHYTSDGTPTDCIMLGIHHLFGKRKPDLIVAGINHGANMGDDVTYSGTVAAALEGAIIKVPSLAVSMANYEPGTPMERAARFVADLVRHLDDFAVFPPSFLSVNLPLDSGRDYRAFEFTRLGQREYGDAVIQRRDPRERDYFWIGGRPSWQNVPGTDFEAVGRGVVSITPLSPDMTDRRVLDRLQQTTIKFQASDSQMKIDAENG